MLASEALHDPGETPPLQFGKYQLDRLLARGGMGEVYLARLVGELGFEHQLVIKTILPEFARAERFIELFAAEAKTAVSLFHGNIVPTYELGRCEDTFYIVMGYVDGPSLAALLHAWAERPPAERVAAAIHIIRNVLNGLSYAHRSEPGRPAVVHRDISARNVLIDRSGQVRIADFGIATRASGRVRIRAGSIGYMPPEQVRGEIADPRADVFSTACLTYELLTGDRPFPKEGIWGPVDLDRVPASVRAPLRSALELEPARRPPDAGAFLKALRPAIVEHAATFGDVELAGALADAFPQGWDSSMPARDGHTRVVEGERRQTFATRLTAVTHLHAADGEGAQAAVDAVVPDLEGTSRDLRRRWLGVVVLVATAFAMGSGLSRISSTAPTPLRSWTHEVDWTSTKGIADRVDDPPVEDVSPPVAPGHARMSVFPPEARVALDGRPLPGAGPFPIPIVVARSQVIEVSLDGYVAERILVPPGQRPPTDVKLRRAAAPPAPRPKASLRVVAPSVPWARVVVDGIPRDHTPTPPVELEAGRHRVRVECIPDVCNPRRVLLEEQIVLHPDEHKTLQAGP